MAASKVTISVGPLATDDPDGSVAAVGGPADAAQKRPNKRVCESGRKQVQKKVDKALSGKSNCEEGAGCNNIQGPDAL